MPKSETKKKGTVRYWSHTDTYGLADAVRGYFYHCTGSDYQSTHEPAGVHGPKQVLIVM